MLFFKKNKAKEDLVLCAPVTGKMIRLEDIQDPVFSSGTMGKGVGFQPSDGTVCAPCDGTIVMLAETLHAFGMETSDGTEILVHIGLDTVDLNGEGFTKLASKGKKVKRGTPVISVDLDLMKEKGIVMTTPLVVTNSDDFDLQIHDCTDVIAGQTEVITYKKK